MADRDYEMAIQKALLDSRSPDTAWGRLKMLLEKNKGKKSKEQIISEWFGGQELNPFQSNLVSLLSPREIDLGGRKRKLDAVNEFDAYDDVKF